MARALTTPARSDLLRRLAEARPALSPSEARVADVVLDHPEAVPRLTLGALAEQAEVSEPTVLRFCRSLGIKGFADFKLELAGALAAGGAPYLHREISFEDTFSTVCAKVFQSSINALATVQDTLDRDVLALVIDRLAKARRIDFMAVGLASILAQDAHQKFMRLRVFSSVHNDAHLQTFSAATLGPGDVAVVFSYNGRIKDVLRGANAAKDAGAFTIAVTRTGTPLARASDLCLAIDVPEDTFVYAPMISRLAHLAVIDVLATGVALARGPGIAAHLEHVKEAMSDQWIVEETPPAGSVAPKRRNQRRLNHDNAA